MCNVPVANRDPSRDPDSQFRYIDISSIDTRTKQIVDARALAGREAPSRARQVVHAQDILVATTRPNLNAVALVPSELDQAIASTGFCVLRCGPEVHPEFVFYLVRLPSFVSALADLTKGSTYPAVTDGQVRNQKIPLAPLPEQKRIAATLREQMAAVEKARAAAQLQIIAARALSAAYLRHAFPDDQWPVRRLGDGLSRIEAGTSVLSLERPAHDGEWGVLKVSAVSWTRFKPEENKAVPVEYTVAPHEQVRVGDFLISRCNTAELVGAVIRVRQTPHNLMLSDKTLRLIPKPEIYASECLEFALRTRTARAFIETNATGTSFSMRNISQDTIRQIPVPTPPIEQQRPIAADLSRRLEEAERLILAINDQRASIDALPAALLCQAFKGAT